jgi:hypothetical protein
VPDVEHLKRSSEYGKLDAIEAEMLVNLVRACVHMSSSHLAVSHTTQLQQQLDAADRTSNHSSSPFVTRLFNPPFRGMFRTKRGSSAGDSHSSPATVATDYGRFSSAAVNGNYEVAGITTMSVRPYDRAAPLPNGASEYGIITPVLQPDSNAALK